MPIPLTCKDLSKWVNKNVKIAQTLPVEEDFGMTTQDLRGQNAIGDQMNLILIQFLMIQ